MDCHNEREQ
jgi:metal transporter CNNM